MELRYDVANEARKTAKQACKACVNGTINRGTWYELLPTLASSDTLSCGQFEAAVHILPGLKGSHGISDSIGKRRERRRNGQ